MTNQTRPDPDLPNMGRPAPRYEARAKVTGKPLYASDQHFADELYAVLVTSVVAKGRVSNIDATEAVSLPGVVKIYTHENTPQRFPVAHFMVGGQGFDCSLE